MSLGNKIRKKGFSLVELSIVLLVIGLLIAGTMKGIDMIENAALKSARSVTQSSPVVNIQDLYAWYETTASTSFGTYIDMMESSSSDIDIWYDINPIKVSKFNLSQDDIEKRPKIVRKAINGLPALLFDGSDDYLANSSVMLSPQLGDYSMIIVGQVFDRSKNNPIFGQYVTGGVDDHRNHFLRLIGGGFAGADQNPPSGAETITEYSFRDNKKFMITHTRSDHVPKIYINGSLKKIGLAEIYEGNDPDITIVGHRNSRSTPSYFNGYIAEIIVFSRALKNWERQSVEKYLSDKWDVEIYY